MKKLLSIFLIIPLFSLGQIFNLNDSTFKVNSVLITNRIFFDHNKESIRPESSPFLDSLVQFLNKNKVIYIEIGNYNNNDLSTKTASKCLTCKRAESIRGYLILKGIDADRLFAIGHMNKVPYVTKSKKNNLKTKDSTTNVSPLNRRTEFKIIQIKDN